MRSRLIGLTALLIAAAPAPSDDPLTRPIGGKSARRWLVPQPPVRIYGNTYLIGFAGLNVGLIRTSAGLIVIDAGLPQGVRAVEANIRALGFDPRAVKWILSTEPHYDHAGGLRAGAKVDPFLDPNGCKVMADKFEPMLDRRLANEAAGRATG